MKTPDEMMDIVNALYLTLPDEIEQEEMACIFTVLLGMFALNLEWHKIKDRVSNNVARSAEHTSELQSPCNLVCRLLLEKTEAA